MQKEIRDAVRRAYEEIGRNGAHPPEGMAFPTGAALARALGYPAEVLARLGPEVLAAYVGAAALPREVLAQRTDPSPDAGWIVDAGCGAGADALWLAGAGLPVAAFDPGEAMLARLASASRTEPVPERLRLFRASLPELPLRDAAASHVLTNGVANLIPEKEALARELFRVLRPGGAWLIADLIALEELDPAMGAAPDAWAFCVAGALTEARWRELLTAAGFADIEIEILEPIPPLARGVVRARKG